MRAGRGRGRRRWRGGVLRFIKERLEFAKVWAGVFVGRILLRLGIAMSFSRSTTERLIRRGV